MSWKSTNRWSSKWRSSRQVCKSSAIMRTQHRSRKKVDEEDDVPQQGGSASGGCVSGGGGRPGGDPLKPLRSILNRIVELVQLLE